MTLKNKIKKALKKIKENIKDFYYDDYGGSLVEYALLIGFALFIFFILIGIIISMLDWTVDQSNDFFDLIGGLKG